MTYKLKDHVTDEMLVAVGFKKLQWFSDTFLIREKNYDDLKSICVNVKKGSKRIVTFSWHGVEENITDKIQDLIELGYVEEMK